MSEEYLNIRDVIVQVIAEYETYVYQKHPVQTRSRFAEIQRHTIELAKLSDEELIARYRWVLLTKLHTTEAARLSEERFDEQLIKAKLDALLDSTVNTAPTEPTAD